MSDRVDELKGNVKEGFGKLTGDERLEAEGDAQADAAKARQETKGAIRQAGASSARTSLSSSNPPTSPSPPLYQASFV
jgi:uncharacterized protein YjbJ (UPF0337 family)